MPVGPNRTAATMPQPMVAPAARREAGVTTARNQVRSQGPLPLLSGPSARPARCGLSGPRAENAAWVCGAARRALPAETSGPEPGCPRPADEVIPVIGRAIDRATGRAD